MTNSTNTNNNNKAQGQNAQAPAVDEKALAAKEQVLYGIIRELLPGGICLAFSGGTDSAVLLTVCLNLQKEAGGQVLPVYAYSVLQCETDEQVKAIAERIGAEPEVVPLSRETMEDVLKNPVERCYYCKTHIFTALNQLAKEAGLKTVMDGTNAEDLTRHRPGLRAVIEQDVTSPFATAGFTKEEVRVLGRKLGVAEADKPADSCMATRVAYDRYITDDLIALLKRGEKYLRDKGYTNVRIRQLRYMCSIEVDRSEIQRLLSEASQVMRDFDSLGFGSIALDTQVPHPNPFDV